MRFIDDDLLGKLIDWHNETDTVVRVDVDDPFIMEILQNRKLRELIEKRTEEIKTSEAHQWPTPNLSKIVLDELQKLLEESKK